MDARCQMQYGSYHQIHIGERYLDPTPFLGILKVIITHHGFGQRRVCQLVMFRKKFPPAKQ